MLAAPLLGLIEFFVAGLGVVFGLSGLRYLRTHPERFTWDRVICRRLVNQITRTIPSISHWRLSQLLVSGWRLPAATTDGPSVAIKFTKRRGFHRSRGGRCWTG